MEAMIGVKTVGQIAREYQIHPVQVTQWKGVIRDRLPELFEPPTGQDQDTQRLVAQLHEKIGELTVELDWLKKSPSNWDSNDAAEPDRVMRGAEHSRAVRAAGTVSQRVLLPGQSGDPGESGPDATARRAASGASGLRESTAARVVASGGTVGESQTGESLAADHGDRGDLSTRVFEPTPNGPSDLSVPARRAGNHGSQPSVVRGHHLRADGLRVHVPCGGDGLVESARSIATCFAISCHPKAG